VTAPEKIFIIQVSDLRCENRSESGKIMRCIISMRKIVAGPGEGASDQLGDLTRSTLAEPGVVDMIKKKVSST
jgi:hypothetical protein